MRWSVALTKKLITQKTETDLQSIKYCARDVTGREALCSTKLKKHSTTVNMYAKLQKIIHQNKMKIT
jgi:hypothetical protein